MLVDFWTSHVTRRTTGAHEATPGLSGGDTTASLSDRDPEGRLISEGLSVGTPGYLAPEAIRGESIGPPSDLYALATVAYEMLTGVVPFKGADGPPPARRTRC